MYVLVSIELLLERFLGLLLLDYPSLGPLDVQLLLFLRQRSFCLYLEDLVLLMIHYRNLVDCYPLILSVIEYCLFDLSLDYPLVVVELLLQKLAVLFVEVLLELDFRS